MNHTYYITYKVVCAKKNPFTVLELNEQFVTVAKLKDLIERKTKITNNNNKKARPGNANLSRISLIDALNGSEFNDDRMIIRSGTSLLVKRLPGNHAVGTRLRVPTIPDPNLIGDDESYKNINDEDKGGVNVPVINANRVLDANGNACRTETENDDTCSKIDGIVQQAQTQMIIQRTTEFMCRKKRAFEEMRSGAPIGTPPSHYCCKICRIPGHFIHHCPQRSERYGQRRPLQALPNNNSNNNNTITHFSRYMQPITDPKNFEKKQRFIIAEGTRAPILDHTSHSPLHTLSHNTSNPRDSVINSNNNISQPCIVLGDQGNLAKAIVHRPSASLSLPNHFLCPLCLKVMLNVTSIDCCLGNFCFECISQHFYCEEACPVCCNVEVERELLPNQALNAKIMLYQERNAEENIRN